MKITNEMKIISQKVKGCYECPYKDSVFGVAYCCFTGKRKLLKNYSLYPRWCPLEDASESEEK
jgi:hypothetical protein